MNIPNVLGFNPKENGCKHRIYVWLIEINTNILIKYFCGGGGRCKYFRAVEDITKVIDWLVVQITALFELFFD